MSRRWTLILVCTCRCFPGRDKVNNRRQLDNGFDYCAKTISASSFNRYSNSNHETAAFIESTDFQEVISSHHGHHNSHQQERRTFDLLSSRLFIYNHYPPRRYRWINGNNRRRFVSAFA
jgi:hypothetical protein